MATLSPHTNDGSWRPLHVLPGVEPILLRQFVLTWRDIATDHQQSLGDLSSGAAMNDSPPCFLNFGVGPSHEVILYLYLPLKINDGPKGLRNIYMVSEAFDTNASDASTDILQITHDPRECPALGRGVEVGAKLLWASFVLKKPSYVLMPVGKPQRPVNERSQGLLLSLKSLSRARSFELYIRDEESNAKHLRSFLRVLGSGRYGNAEIDHKASFNGRPWGMNSWKTFRLRDDETLVGVWNPLSDESPPSYKETLQKEKAPIPGPQEINDHDNGDGDGPGEPQMLAGQEHPDKNNEGQHDAQRVEESELEGGRDASQLTDIPQEVPQSGHDEREESEETIILEGRQRQGNSQHLVHTEYDVQEERQQDRHRKRNAREARLDATPGPSRSGSSARPESSKQRAKVHKKTSFVIHNDEASGHGTAIEQQSGEHHSAEHQPADQHAFEDESMHILNDNGVFHTSSILGHGPTRSLFDEAQFHWFCNALLWLATAWRGNHSIHDVYLEELHILCRAILRRDRRTFESTRVRCMTMFVQRERTSQEEGPFACALMERTQWMVNFIYQKFGPGHDVVLVDEIVALHETARHWMLVGGGDIAPTAAEDRQEYIRRENGFYFQLAACLLLACYMWERRERHTGQ